MRTSSEEAGSSSLSHCSDSDEQEHKASERSSSNRGEGGFDSGRMSSRTGRMSREWERAGEEVEGKEEAEKLPSKGLRCI